MTNFTFIDTPEALTQEAKHWQVPEVAIDLECENNLHHYGAYLSIIQISTRAGHWIVDVLKLKQVPELVQLFENPKITKIFHDVGFDLRIIKHELHCHTKNIIDTQIAAAFLGKKELGLGALLQEYFGVHKEHKFQMADWTKRPLTKEMLQYAAGDTLYLLKLKDTLQKELEALGHWKWVEEEFATLEKKEWEYKEGTYSDVKGYTALSPAQRGILKELFHLRERLAKKVDRPVHFIISTRQLMEYAQAPPHDWSRISRVHPIVKSQAHLFSETVEKGKKEEIHLPERERKFYSAKQKQKLEELSQLRDKVAEELKIPKHLFLNQDQMQNIVLTGKYDGLRKWQRELVGSG